jgi:hypothetical protein
VPNAEGLFYDIIQRMRRKIGKGFLIIFGIIVLKFLITFPSHDRHWLQEQSLLPFTSFNGDIVTISNIRDFHLDASGQLVPQYIDRVYDLRSIEGVDFVLSRFSDSAAVAHSFVTFRFENAEPLAISIESRREKGEVYSPLKGLFQAYEEIYVIGTERDLIGRRSHIKKEEVYLFPGNTTPEKARELLISMLEYANDLTEKPVFYNTLTNQCTSKLAWHIRTVSDRSLPLSYKILLPGFSDQMAYDTGFIQSNIPFEELKQKSLIKSKNLNLNDPDFSQKIF